MACSRTILHLLDNGKNWRETLNVLLLASFVGVQPVGEVEQEHDAEFLEDFKVVSVRDAMGFPFLWAYLPLGSLTSSAAPATQRGH